jgi:kinesin family member C2/C3
MNDNIILQLRQDLEASKNLHETHCQELETRAAQVNKKSEQRIKEIELMLEDSTNRRRELEEISEASKKLHETHYQELETRAAQMNKKSEQRIKEIELMLEDSTNRRRELEEISESRIQFWKQKEIVVNQFVGLQIKNAQVLVISLLTSSFISLAKIYILNLNQQRSVSSGFEAIFCFC